jgi:chemotaxis signal transduction protein
MSNEILVFRLASQHYGLPVKSVVEVIHMVAMTILPDVPAGTLGVINYRGDVIPLLDLRQALEVPAQKVHLNSPIIIAQAEQHYLGLLADQVEGVASGDDFEPTAMMTKHISSITKINDRMILMINLQDFAVRV